MKREWKPGMVGSIDTRGEDARVMFTGYHWVSASGELLNPQLVPRPLIVIDPESDEDCERLAKAWSGLKYAELGDKPMCLNAYRMQAALREFANPTPPRPDEPLGLGAVVKSSNGDRWVRVETATNPDHLFVWVCEADEEVNPREWADVNAVRVLSEGVTP